MLFVEPEVQGKAFPFPGRVVFSGDCWVLSDVINSPGRTLLPSTEVKASVCPFLELLKFCAALNHADPSDRGTGVPKEDAFNWSQCQGVSMFKAQHIQVCARP